MTDQEIETPTTESESTETSSDAGKKEDNRIGYLTRKVEKLEKQLEKTEPVEPQPEDETDFKIYHASEIKLCTDEFKSYRKKGYTSEDSLRLAKLDKGITDKPSSEVERQAAEGSPSATVQRATKPTEDVSDDLIQMAGSKEKALELKKKYGHMVRKVG